MRGMTLWSRLLGVEHTIVEDADWECGALIMRVRPAARQRFRCPKCRRTCPKYDRGQVRRWRHLDFGAIMVFLEAQAPRVRCKRHGVIVAAVPWARHGAGHTHAFDDQVAWLATRTSKSAACELMRITWRTVGSIITRVWADLSGGADRLGGLRRIGIDEVSYKKGHKYLIVVVDHDTRRLVWAAEGRDSATLNEFFAALGAQRCAQLTHITCDAASWITKSVAAKCPQAIVCADPFHIVSWATEALDELRRARWREAAAAAKTEKRPGPGRPPKGTPPRQAAATAGTYKTIRWALWKNPEDLTEHQQFKLEWLQTADPALHRGYLLKEGLRLVFQAPDRQTAEQILDRWCSWASRSRLEPFVKLGRTIKAHRADILAAIENKLSNGLIESVNTKIRLLTRIAFGFHSATALIALAMLSLGGTKPQLPGR